MKCTQHSPARAFTMWGRSETIYHIPWYIYGCDDVSRAQSHIFIFNRTSTNSLRPAATSRSTYRACCALFKAIMDFRYPPARWRCLGCSMVTHDREWTTQHSGWIVIIQHHALLTGWEVIHKSEIWKSCEECVLLTTNTSALNYSSLHSRQNLTVWPSNSQCIPYGTVVYKNVGHLSVSA